MRDRSLALDRPDPRLIPFLDDLAHLLAKSYIRDRERREQLKSYVRAFAQKMVTEVEEEAA